MYWQGRQEESVGQQLGGQHLGTPFFEQGVPEVPFSLRENEDVKTVNAYFPLGRYGFGADVVAGGMCIVKIIQNPSSERLSGIAESFGNALRLVGAEEYAQSLGEVRTDGQKSILSALVDRALYLIPEVAVPAQSRDKNETRVVSPEQAEEEAREINELLCVIDEYDVQNTQQPVMTPKKFDMMTINDYVGINE